MLKFGIFKEMKLGLPVLLKHADYKYNQNWLHIKLLFKKYAVVYNLYQTDVLVQCFLLKFKAV